MNFSALREVDFWKNLFIVVAAIAAAIFAGTYVSRNRIGFQEVALIAIVICFVSAIAGERGLRINFIAWILLFALGHRTLAITPNFPLHPLVVMIWGLFLLILLNGSQRKTDVRLNWKLPKFVILFSLFWIWGFLLGILWDRPVDSMLFHISNFATLIPIFLVTQYVMKDEAWISRGIKALYAAGTIIAVLGCLEYYFPDIANRIPGLYSGIPTLTARDFERAAFSFFGNPGAAFICGLVLPFGLYLFPRSHHLAAKALVIACALFLLLGIYISGARSLWIAVCVVAVLYAVLQRNILVAVALVAGFILLLQFAPASLTERFDSATSALSGNIVDSSAATRLERGVDAMSLITSNPLGLGWTASGWVHNDILQLAADTGVLGAATYVLWYATTVVRLVGYYLTSRSSLAMALLMGMVVMFILLLFNPIYVRSYFVIPLWFVWALAEFLLHQDKIGEVSGAYRPNSYV